MGLSCWAELCSDAWCVAFILVLLIAEGHIQVSDYIKQVCIHSATPDQLNH